MSHIGRPVFATNDTDAVVWSVSDHPITLHTTGCPAFSPSPVDAQRDGFDLALQDQAGGQAVQAARQPFRGVVAAHLARPRRLREVAPERGVHAEARQGHLDPREPGTGRQRFEQRRAGGEEPPDIGQDPFQDGRRGEIDVDQRVDVLQTDLPGQPALVHEEGAPVEAGPGGEAVFGRHLIGDQAAQAFGQGVAGQSVTQVGGEPRGQHLIGRSARLHEADDGREHEDRDEGCQQNETAPRVAAGPVAPDTGPMRHVWHGSLLPLLALYTVTAVWSRPGPVQTVFLALLAIPLIAASVTDLRAQVIPDWTSLAVAGLGLAAPVLGGWFPDPVTFAVAAGLTAVLALCGEVFWRRTGREALGLGDVKLIGAGTLVIGADRVWSMLLIASAGGIAAVLLSGKGRRRAIPFGPFLAYAVFATTAFRGAG